MEAVLARGSHSVHDKTGHHHISFGGLQGNFELTNEERGNVAADKLAEKQYDAPLNIERPWETTSSGQVIIETNIRQYRAITGNTTKTILKHTRRMNTRAALDKERELPIPGHGPAIVDRENR